MQVGKNVRGGVKRRSFGRGGDRLRVAVLMGGPSSEHEISLQGGGKVVDALDPQLFDVRPVVITRDGHWRVHPKHYHRTEEPFDPYASEGWPEFDGVLKALVHLQEWQTDVVVPVLHGRFGEDGTLQACLTAADLPYVGSGSGPSAVANDKVFTKEILSFHGIRTPPFEVLKAAELERGRAKTARRLIDAYGTPLVLKDPCGGSSIEVRLVANIAEAVAAMDELVPPAERLMAERHVKGRELTAGVIYDREVGRHVALPIVEIRPRRGSSFDYFEKYNADGAEELCPAPLAEAVEAEARALGLRVHEILGLEGLSRTDLILDDRGNLHVLEVNTLPGMTDRGLVPRAAKEIGMSFPALIDNLVRTASVH
ncbi:MAG: D-alanine--D-alanine ligase family protein [Planctomycetota bacterium]|jgi:D-alanine-D-alanine ligase